MQDQTDLKKPAQSKEKTRKIALSGILSALIAVALLVESIVPTGRLGFYVLAAFILSVVLLKQALSGVGRLIL